MTNTQTKTTTPKPKLHPGTVYIAHERFLCVDCAGMTALYTGKTIGGARLSKVRPTDIADWATYDLGPLTCDCGKVTAS